MTTMIDGGRLRVLVIVSLVAGCARSLPPEVPEFKVPAARKPAQSAPAASEPARAVAEAPPAEAPAPPPAPVEKPASAPAPPPAAPVKVEAPKEPSIIGSWQVVEMSHNGQVQQMPAGVTMTFTFAEGGSLSMGMTGGPAEAGGARQGTYSVSGGQITVSMENETRTGSLTFEGNDRAVMDFTEARMVLSRSS